MSIDIFRWQISLTDPTLDCAFFLLLDLKQLTSDLLAGKHAILGHIKQANIESKDFLCTKYNRICHGFFVLAIQRMFFFFLSLAWNAVLPFIQDILYMKLGVLEHKYLREEVMALTC